MGSLPARSALSLSPGCRRAARRAGARGARARRRRGSTTPLPTPYLPGPAREVGGGVGGRRKRGCTVEGERGAPRGGVSPHARRSERETTESSLKRSVARASYFYTSARVSGSCRVANASSSSWASVCTADGACSR